MVVVGPTVDPKCKGKSRPKEFWVYSQPELPRFITNPHNNDTRSVDELARDKAGEDNDVREDNQQSGGDYSEDEEGDNEEVQDESEESD
ncbi:hypothetical protein Tco_0373491 [Tanacetum coccineum]